MIRPVVTIAAAVLAINSANAQDEPDTVVESIVVVDGAQISQGRVPASQSGLTVDPLIQSAAEAIRLEAELSLKRGYLPSQHTMAQPQVTSVSIESVTVVRPDAVEGEACVQVGVIGGRHGCRPPRK